MYVLSITNRHTWRNDVWKWVFDL